MITTLYDIVYKLHTGRVFEYPMYAVNGDLIKRYVARCRCGWESLPASSPSTARSRGAKHAQWVWVEQEEKVL